MSITLMHGDCLDLIADLPAASVDAVITDPPYQQTALTWDLWPAGWPDVIARVLKSTGSMWVFGTLRMFLDRRDDFASWRLAQDIIWEKHNGSSMRTDRFRRVHEQAAQFYRGNWADIYKGKVVTMDARKREVRRTLAPAHLNRTGPSLFTSEEGGPRIMRSVIYARSQHGAAIHPTQKPEAIIEPLILNACPPGGVVLDPFGGSGTTAVVAARLGRKAISIEADPAHDQAATQRLKGDLLTAPLTAGGAA